MKQKLNNPWNVFALGVIITFLLFFLIPINLFDGEIVFKEGGREWKQQANISLSYFLGIGAQPEELARIGVKDFYLLPKGYAVAFLVLFGFPGLIAYRIHLGKQKKQNLLENSKK